MFSIEAELKQLKKSFCTMCIKIHRKSSTLTYKKHVKQIKDIEAKKLW